MDDERDMESMVGNSVKARIMSLLANREGPYTEDQILKWTWNIAGDEWTKKGIESYVKDGLLIQNEDGTYITANEYPGKGIIEAARKDPDWTQNKKLVDNFFEKEDEETVD